MGDITAAKTWQSATLSKIERGISPGPEILRKRHIVMDDSIRHSHISSNPEGAVVFHPQSETSL